MWYKVGQTEFWRAIGGDVKYINTYKYTNTILNVIKRLSSAYFRIGSMHIDIKIKHACFLAFFVHDINTNIIFNCF